MELTFDQRGNLYPHDKHKLKMEDFRFFFIEKFPENSHRRKLFANYLKFVDDFSKEITGTITQWIDGSF